jgi:hypothetical protein
MSTWTKVNPSNFSKIITDATGQKLVGLYNNLIYTSSNKGVTWSTGVAVNTDNIINDIAADITLQYIVVAGTTSSNGDTYIYRSSNSGVTFQELTATESSKWNRVSSSSNGQYLLATESTGVSQKELWYSKDSGTSWNKSTPDVNLVWNNLASSSDGNRVIAGGYDPTGSGTTQYIYTSTTGGQNILQRQAIVDNIFINSLTCDSTGQYAYAALGTSGVYKSVNYGADWTKTSAATTGGIDYNSVSTDSTGTNVLAYDQNSHNTYLSSDSGATWILQVTPGIVSASTGGTVRISSDASSLYSATPNVGLFYLDGNSQPSPSPSIACFKQGSKILTNKGYISIENLRKGDLIKTINNGYVSIDMIGYREIYNRICEERIKDKLYIYTSKEYPEIFEDLIITGCHSILVDEFKEDEKEKTSDVLGNIYITDDKYRLPACVDKKAKSYEKNGLFTIYHIALENDNYYMNYGIYANGLLVETCSKRYLCELSEMTLINE